MSMIVCGFQAVMCPMLLLMFLIKPVAMALETYLSVMDLKMKVKSIRAFPVLKTSFLGRTTPFPSYGAIVSGVGHTTTASHASAIGGKNNTATRDY